MKNSSNNSLVLSLAIIVILIVAIVLVLVLGKSNKGLTPAQTSAAKSQIQTNWQTFFAASTPLQTRENLLQNGSQFNSSISSEFMALGSQKSSAVISSVNLNSPTSASVNYNVELNGQTVLSNQSGQAVLSNGQWKVSQATFCNLLKMGGSEPTICKNIIGS